MAHILDRDAISLIRALGRAPRSRAELAEMTGWSRNTVAAKLTSLIETNWVVDPGLAQGERGRPYTRFRLNPQAALVYVANFGVDHLTGTICTLDGQVLATETRPFIPAAEGHDALTEMVDLFGQLSRRAAVEGKRVKVAIVGVPNPIASATFRVPWSVVGLLPVEIEKALGMPAAVENDANLMALGACHDYPGAQSLLFIKVATGIGAGLALSGSLHRGLLGWAGEVGHIPIARAAGRICICGNTGCVVNVAGVNAILRALTTPARPVTALGDLERLVLTGDADAITALRQAGRDIGEAIIGPAIAVAPEMIVVGGRITQLGDHLSTGIRESLARLTFPALSSRIQVVSCPDHQSTSLRGAMDLAFDHLFPANNAA